MSEKPKGAVEKCAIRIAPTQGVLLTLLRLSPRATDVLGIPKTDEFFRMLYDTKGRFKLHRITKEEASYKLCKVKRCQLGDKAVPYVGLHDSRTIRYPDPDVKVNDSVKVDIESGKITAIFKFDIGQLATIVGGRNAGRAGTIARLEKHKGSHDIAHLRDSAGNTFATRAENVFIIGKENRPWSID